MADKSKPVNFRALQLVHEQRNGYGIRYNDFQRYRKHCANRTHRLRSSLKMNHGKGKDFKSLPRLNPDTMKAEHLQLLLFEAERGWAYAQDLHNTSLLPANKEKAGKFRHRATGRFRKAVNWSTQLLSICQTLHASCRMSTENLIEATIYTIILNSRFLRYRDDFEDALIQLSVAKGLLDKLATTASNSRDQALAILFVDEIGPEIRYCAHELGHARAYDINSIVTELYPKYGNQVVENCDTLVSKLQKDQSANPRTNSTLRERMWDGKAVPVRYPELADVFLKVEVAEVALEKSGTKKTKTGVTAYDAVLSALSDAEDVARKLRESQQPTTVMSGTLTRDIHFVHAYIVYQLLSRRIQRDLLLMSTLLSSSGADMSKGNISKHSDQKEFDSRLFPAVVKLLDTVIQSLTQIRALSVVDDNPELASAVDARLSLTKGRRCSYLARCYAAVKRYSEALTLQQHAAIHLRETLSSLSLSDLDLINEGTPPFFPLSKDDVKELEASITEDNLQCKRDWFAHNGGSADASPSAYKKPLFFNIALNYIDLDMDRLRERAGKERASITAMASSSTQGQSEKKVPTKAKVEELSPEPTSASTQPTRGGLSSLLGGWWK